MEKIIAKIKQIYIEKRIKSHQLVERFISTFPSVQIKYIDDHSRFSQNILPNGDKFATAKKTIILAVKKGKFISEFYLHPILKGNPIFSINHSIGCLYDCHYCYLQAYQDYPAFVQFVNLEKIPLEIEQIIKDFPDKTPYFSSGIMSDSLLFDHITGLCSQLFPIFDTINKAKLEIRTRTTNISHLINAALPRNNVVVTWSLSPEEIITKYEPLTSSAQERLKAAALCQRYGYKIGFHLDPLIHYSNWKRGYQNLTELMQESLDPAGIEYIFLGSFRYKHNWAKVFRKRFPKSLLLLDEFVLSADGKFRYFKPIRLEMYCTITKLLENWNQNIPIYLSMEPPEIWRRWEECRAIKRR